MILVEVVHAGSDLTVLGIISKLIGWVAGVLAAYLVWRIRVKETENTKLKEVVYTTKSDLAEHRAQDELKKQSFEDYVKYKEKEDKAFARVLERFGAKIDSLTESFDTKFGDLTKEIQKLELKIAKQ